jgi:subtilase family serine protease
LQIVDSNCDLCQPNGTVTATLCNPGSTIGQWYDSTHVLVKVDHTNKLAESNESNNEMEENTLTFTSPYGG